MSRRLEMFDWIKSQNGIEEGLTFLLWWIRAQGSGHCAAKITQVHSWIKKKLLAFDCDFPGAWKQAVPLLSERENNWSP